MGMFDRFFFEYPLPFPEELDATTRAALQADEWQTKDLRCELAQYRLDAQGKLWREEKDWENETAPARWLPVTNEIAKVRVYTSVGDERSGWLEFEVVIVDGRLHRAIRLEKYRPVDPVEEKKRAAHREAFFKDLLD